MTGSWEDSGHHGDKDVTKSILFVDHSHLYNILSQCIYVLMGFKMYNDLCDCDMTLFMSMKCLMNY